MNRYFKTSDAKNFAFYKVPKALFEEKYKSVSTDAKMLYGLLLDRMYLSVKNGWIDKQGRVYQYFTIKSAQEKLHFGHEKICKLFSELETADLILRKRQHYLSKTILIFSFLDFRITEGIKTYRVRHYLPKKKIYRRSPNDTDNRYRLACSL